MSPPPSHEPAVTDASLESLQLGVQRSGDPSSAVWHRFEHGPVVIGSHARCSLRLDDPTVAPWSLYVQRLSDRVLVIDLGSGDCGQRTGVLSRPGRRYLDLFPAGVPVQVGEFQIWHTAARPNAAETNPLSDQDPLPALTEPIAVWEIFNVRGDAVLNSRRVRHELTLIGQGPLCRFRMVHDTIAEIHASLVIVHDQLLVNDLCSEHGVYVNGHKVSQAPLQDGDELRIGQCRGRIRRLSHPRLPAVNSTINPLVPPQTLEASVTEPAQESSADGIEVSLSDTGVTVRNQSPRLTSSTTGESLSVGPGSEEYLLLLLSQFLEMQRSQLEQTQQLMQNLAERLLQTQAATGADFAGSEDDSVRPLPETDEFVECIPAEEPNPPSKDSDERRRGRNSPQPAHLPELHTWLTHQLAGLEKAQRKGMTRLWQRLIGSE